MPCITCGDAPPFRTGSTGSAGNADPEVCSWGTIFRLGGEVYASHRGPWPASDAARRAPGNTVTIVVLFPERDWFLICRCSPATK